MAAPDVAVIDYGVGNLLSVRRGLERSGGQVTVTSEPSAILSASFVVLPGVGAFGNGMAELTRPGLDAVVREVAARGTPLLGICLGMQMLLDGSEEFGATNGLGLVAGRVTAVPDRNAAGEAQKIPHIGWSPLSPVRGEGTWAGTILETTKPGDEVYFVHSFMARPTDPAHHLAHTLYGGMPVTAVVSKDNVSGCQFHPEKSGEVGLRILKRFLGL